MAQILSKECRTALSRSSIPGMDGHNFNVSTTPTISTLMKRTSIWSRGISSGRDNTSTTKTMHITVKLGQ